MQKSRSVFSSLFSSLHTGTCSGFIPQVSPWADNQAVAVFFSLHYGVKVSASFNVQTSLKTSQSTDKPKATFSGCQSLKTQTCHKVGLRTHRICVQVFTDILVLGRIFSLLESILGFHVTSEKTKIKLKLKILSYYLYRVKVIFKRISAGLSTARLTALF